jgi:hypothetical protein
MGSHPTLDHQQLATEARQLDPDDGRHSHAVAYLAAEHSQVRTWADDNPDRTHELDPRDGSYDHPHPSRERDAERTFDRLNPEFGVPADQHNPYGRQVARDREAALALGVRVAVHDSRQNDPNPVIWQAGQDYRTADAIQAARHHLSARARHGPERVGVER